MVATPKRKASIPWKTYGAIAVVSALVLWAVEHPGNFLGQLIRLILAP